jgi:hypothetical protein
VKELKTALEAALPMLGEVNLRIYAQAELELTPPTKSPDADELRSHARRGDTETM